MNCLMLTAALAGVVAFAGGGGRDTTVKLTVPKSVAAHAALRAAGDSKVSPPILILEGVELGEGEGITIRVLGPAATGAAKSAPVLGSASMVGHPQKVPKRPLRKTTLTVPLNDRAVELLAGRSEIILTLRVTNSPGRAPLKIERVFFQEPDR
ncbi:MAG TPA: hypothetical protein VJ864_15565 [Candidatus Binatia bacterium]|jgi:hypothetical protein|nr:hypothetical protein [Candidatus Binatia bacterium]